MTDFQKIEKCVHWTVAKPLSLAVYGLWLAGRCLATGARSTFTWLRRGAGKVVRA
jgi:hypothetical protein